MEMNLVSTQLSNEKALKVIIHVITCASYQQPQAATATFEFLETLVFCSCRFHKTPEFCLLYMYKIEQT